jgi:radial spoke head protein 3
MPQQHAGGSQTQTDEGYGFSSSPRALASSRAGTGGGARRPKYRESAPADKLGGTMPIHTDPRVRRGSAKAHLEQLQAQAAADAQTLRMTQQRRREAKQRRQRMLAREQEKNYAALAAADGADVPPVAGRSHMEVQTDVYLEEIVDKKIEKDTSTQTDPFLDRPSTPEFVPKKSGVDESTQIEPGELFDFDAEVEPILSVLVAKTLEQALIEVHEEEEVARMIKHREEFALHRAAELEETKRLEEEEAERQRERAARAELELARKEAAELEATRGAAQELAKQFMAPLEDEVLDHLHKEGHFYDAVLDEIDSQFMPWLLDEVEEHLTMEEEQVHAIVDDIIADALSRGIESQHELVALLQAQAEAAAASAAAAAAAAEAKAEPGDELDDEERGDESEEMSVV